MKRLTLVCSIVLLLSGCLAKKKVAEAIDAAGPPDPVATADADAGAVAAAEPDADLTPLAPLAVAKPAAAVKPRKPAPPVANPDAPNCANARLYCNHPQVGTNPKIKDQCTGFTAECLRAGGKV